MAVLQSGNLSFNAQFADFESGYIKYNFYFLWKDEPIINDEIIDRSSEYRKNIPKGGIIADDYYYFGKSPSKSDNHWLCR